MSNDKPTPLASNPVTHEDLLAWGRRLDGERPHSLGSSLVRYAQAWAADRSRLQAALISHACHCGPTDLDPSVHREDCAYRLALSGEPAPKRAYYETHEPPHCPTCDCGSAHETAGKPTPCWCPHCNQPHSPRVQATDPRNIENPVCTNCGYRKSAHAGNDLDCPHSGPGRKEVFVRTAEKAESRRVAPPKFCAVDECMNRVAPDQEVCDQCAQKASDTSLTGE